jgi:transcription factor TFIIIB component B''
LTAPSEQAAPLWPIPPLPQTTRPPHVVSLPPAGPSPDRVEILSSSSAPLAHLPTNTSSGEHGSNAQLDFSAIVEAAARAASAGFVYPPPELASPQDEPFPAPALRLDAESIVKPSRPTEKRAATENAGGAQDEQGVAKKRRTRARRIMSEETPTGEVATVSAEAEPKRRRQAARVSTPQVTDSDDDQSADALEKRRRRTASARPRRERASSAPFDADADPGEDLDPTIVTMADLCEDTGQGRVSSKAAQIFENHHTWRRSNRERRVRMRVAMEAKKYGHDEDGDGPSTSTLPSTDPGSSEAQPSSSALPTAQGLPQPEDLNGGGDGEDVHCDDKDDDEDDDFDYSKVVGRSRFAAQVRIGANGETILDETSLVIDRDEEQETSGYAHVEESDATKFTNSSTYSKRYHGSRWSAEETELFFDVRLLRFSCFYFLTSHQALRQFGENYELISYVLPGRDRKSCKNKFKAEDKKNPERIDHCLKNRVPYGTFKRVASVSRTSSYLQTWQCCRG